MNPLFLIPLKIITGFESGLTRLLSSNLLRINFGEYP
jgi:hypothetical protein